MATRKQRPLRRRNPYARSLRDRGGGAHREGKRARDERTGRAALGMWVCPRCATVCDDDESACPACGHTPGGAP